MKVVCPVCGVQGVLQERGNSSRIQHYIGFKDGKRAYLYHKLEVNGSKFSEVNQPNPVAKLRKMEPSAGFGPATITLPR